MVNTLKTWWKRLAPMPMGKWFFSKLIGLFIPYTGTISPYVIKAEPGVALVGIKDRRKHRNHLRSIHAIALINLGEFTTGLLVHFTMGPENRAILTQISAEFIKKARGEITAKAEINPPFLNQEGPIMVDANLFDEAGNLVAKVRATWLLGKIPKAISERKPKAS